MSGQIHFEIFVRRKTGGWTLHEALSDRAHARKQAEGLLGANGVVQVKVAKETLDGDGTFQSVVIFEAGEKEKQKKKPKSSAPAIPCFKPQDLHGPHARATMSRVLTSVLREWSVTPIELVHSGDLLEKLEARSTTLQGAVQQVAVAMATNSDHTVQEIYRQLIDLCLRAMDRVVQDERKGRLKPLSGQSLADFVNNLPDGSDVGYLCAAAIAKDLRPIGADTGAKLERLLSFLAELPETEEARAAASDVVDGYVSELIRTPGAISAFAGKDTETGDALRLLADLFLGRMEKLDPSAGALRDLAAALKDGSLPSTMAALSQILMTEIKSSARLHPSCFQREIETIRHLAQQLVYGVGTHLSLDDLTEAFLIRSRRLVTPEAISTYLEAVDTPDARISKLVELEENIVGTQSKKTLVSFILPLISSVQLETLMLDDRQPITQRLQRIAELQRETAAAGFEDDDTLVLTDALGRLGEKIEERGHFYRSFELKRAPSADKALALMRLKERGVLPDGPCWSRGRELVRSFIRKTDFAASLCPDALERDAQIARREEFRRLFELLEIGAPKAPARQAETAA